MEALRSFLGQAVHDHLSRRLQSKVKSFYSFTLSLFQENCNVWCLSLPFESNPGNRIRLFSAVNLESRFRSTESQFENSLARSRPAFQQWTTLYRTSKSISMMRTKFESSTPRIQWWPRVWLNNVTISFRVISFPLNCCQENFSL